MREAIDIGISSDTDPLAGDGDGMPSAVQMDCGDVLVELNKVKQHLESAQIALNQMARDSHGAELRATRAERCRLAQMLHDGLQQVLVAAKMRLCSAIQLPPSDGSKQAALQALELLNEAIQVSRTLTLDLSPLHFADEGLGAALIWLSNWFATHHALSVTVEVAADAEPESEPMRTLVFQGVREILFNAVKHAGIDKAAVKMVRSDGHIHIIIEDRGIGFHPQWFESKTDGFGLFSLRKRLEQLGGAMEVVSAPGAGTRVTLRAPLGNRTGAQVSHA